MQLLCAYSPYVLRLLHLLPLMSVLPVEGHPGGQPGSSSSSFSSNPCSHFLLFFAGSEQTTEESKGEVKREVGKEEITGPEHQHAEGKLHREKR